jgi:hypothetical protein
MFSDKKYSHKLAPTRVYLRRTLIAFLIAFSFLSFSLALGVWGYYYFAQLSLIDSLLNASMILGGMGPVDILKNDSSKLFASFYSIYSGITFLSSIGVLIAPSLHRLLHKFHIDDANDANSN